MVTNISSESIIAQKVEKEKEANAPKKVFNNGNFSFDEKHYLNTRLGKNEETKEITVRLLPFSEKEVSPFKKVYVHSVRITNEEGKKQWKKFMCPLKMHKSDKCPFCEISEEARKLVYQTEDEKLKKEYKEAWFTNSPQPYWIVRCIDREHEEEGVKFWRFPDARNGKGIWDNIYAIFEAKRKRGVEIFDLYNGKDLIITVKKTKDSSGKEKMVYQIQDDEGTRPLSESEEQMEKWVNDPMKLDDVYSTKDYDYLSIVIEGGTPVWSKDMNRWISKEDSDKIKKEAQEQELIENLQQKQSQDFSSFAINTGQTDTERKIESEPSNQNDDTDIDLPF